MAEALVLNRRSDPFSPKLHRFNTIVLDWLKYQKVGGLSCMSYEKCHLDSCYILEYICFDMLCSIGRSGLREEFGGVSLL